MALATIPNAEKIVGNYLRAHPDLVALNARVVGKPPDDKDSSPWILLTMIDAVGNPDLTPDHLVDYFLQLDCYSDHTGGQPQANSLGYATRATLVSMKGAVHDGAVVANVRFASMSRTADADGFEPARDRVIISVYVTMHNV